MIRHQKQALAHHSLQFILTRARWRANESRQFDVADMLDRTEILPQLIADEDDRTDEYRTALVAIAERYTECSHAALLFDEKDNLP